VVRNCCLIAIPPDHFSVIEQVDLQGKRPDRPTVRVSAIAGPHRRQPHPASRPITAKGGRHMLVVHFIPLRIFAESHSAFTVGIINPPDQAAPVAGRAHPVGH